MDNQMGGAVLLDGKIYGSGHTNREWFCLDWKTGDVLHSAKMLSNGNVVYADGNCIVTAIAEKLLLLMLAMEILKK